MGVKRNLQVHSGARSMLLVGEVVDRQLVRQLRPRAMRKVLREVTKVLFHDGRRVHRDMHWLSARRYGACLNRKCGTLNTEHSASHRLPFAASTHGDDFAIRWKHFEVALQHSYTFQ